MKQQCVDIFLFACCCYSAAADVRMCMQQGCNSFLFSHSQLKCQKMVKNISYNSKIMTGNILLWIEYFHLSYIK